MNLPPGSAAAALVGQPGILAGYTPVSASTGFTFAPAADLQTPGFYTPVAAGGLAVGAVGGSTAAGIRGTAATIPGIVAATTGPRGGLVFSNALSAAGGSLGTAPRPPAGPTGAVGLGIAGVSYGQQGGSMGFVDPTTAAYGAGRLSGWGAANGLYGSAGQLQQQISGDGLADAAANAGFGLLQQTSSGVEAAADPATQQGPQDQQLAMQLQYQQQLRAQMILMGQQQAAAAAGSGNMQFVAGLQQQQQPVVQNGTAAAVVNMNALNPAAQQQQWLLWQQSQSQMMWAASPTAAQPMQDVGGQGLPQQQ